MQSITTTTMCARHAQETTRNACTLAEYHRHMTISSRDIANALDAFSTSQTPCATVTIAGAAVDSSEDAGTFDKCYPGVSSSSGDFIEPRAFKVLVKAICIDFRCEMRWTVLAFAALHRGLESFLAFALPNTAFSAASANADIMFEASAEDEDDDEEYHPMADEEDDDEEGEDAYASEGCDEDDDDEEYATETY